MEKQMLGWMLAVVLICQGCSYPLAEDIALVRSEAPRQSLPLTMGKAVEGAAYYPYLVGFNLTDAVDRAFDNAGPEYDILVNTRVDFKYYYFLVYYSQYVRVRGTAVNSAALKGAMGAAAYDKWISGNGIRHRTRGKGIQPRHAGNFKD